MWTDGSNALCTDWDNGQPNDDATAADEDCVRLKRGKWWDSDCTYVLPYICELNSTA